MVNDTGNIHSDRVQALIAQMTLDEKLGQMNQLNGAGGAVSEPLADAIRCGRVGSIINEVNASTLKELQRIAREESRLGIPLLIGRDVIHGFETVFPIPLALAASWCPDVVEKTARVSAIEASGNGINWTFSPMIDIARDPRWGRVAESFGEDPLLSAALGAAMVKGYQTDDLSGDTAILACAKHFVGYGASESGRDYNTTNISEHDLRNIHLPPFKACSEIGVGTFMTSFSDVNGMPASGNQYLLDDILKQEWQFSGFVVSDWGSVQQLTVHGVAADDEHAAALALNAGVDMEMVSETFIQHASTLLQKGVISQDTIDQAVARILTCKFRLGLFEGAFISGSDSVLPIEEHFEAAKQAALKSCVLLTNHQKTLPLDKYSIDSIGVLGWLAHDDYEQLGTWIFDGDTHRSTTILQGIQNVASDEAIIHYQPVFSSSRDMSVHGFCDAKRVADESDVVIVCVGEESILSGEAHCRSDIGLPGAQVTFIETISEHLSANNKPIILVCMAGRPLDLSPVVDKVDAILYAWHPGSAGGQAIAELLFGLHSPSGKLPISFPRTVGQIPIYYAQKPTGRPVTSENYAAMADFPMRAEQTSLGMAASHMDTYFTPLFPFGYGLSYANIQYAKPELSSQQMHSDETLLITLKVTNTTSIDAEDIVQLYIRDEVASATRPVRELKAFKRVVLPPQSETTVEFELTAEALAFYDANGIKSIEPGYFTLGVGGDSTCELTERFEMV